MATIEITKENFEIEVANCEKPVLIDFWAQWCVPCKMVAPIIDEIASENNSIKVGKIDVDTQSELAEAFGIKSIPTLAVIKGGKVVEKSSGVKTKEAILQMLK